MTHFQIPQKSTELNNSVCLVEDEQMWEETIWIADLSNGQRVYMDDNRPGKYPHSAWERLKYYVESNKLQINNFFLRFRSHTESPLPTNAKGYFFKRKLKASPFLHEYFIIIGYVTNDGNTIDAQEWRVPDLEHNDKYLRYVDKEPESCLIMNG